MSSSKTKAKTKANRKTIFLVYTGICAALIAVCSLITIPSAVPFTLQTLAICLSAGLFGAKIGTSATLIYILLGLIGLPVFSGFKGGAGVLLGSTGGYIVGFIFTALIVGIVSDKFGGKVVPMIISMVIGVLVCYAFGTAWFAVVYAKANEPAALTTILGWCVIPFIIPDAVKIAVAVLLSTKLRRVIPTA